MMIELAFLKELMLIRQNNQDSVIGLSFSWMSAICVTMY